MDPQASQAYTSMMKFTMDGRPYIKVHITPIGYLDEKPTCLYDRTFMICLVL